MFIHRRDAEAAEISAESNATGGPVVEWDGKPQRHFDAKARNKNAPTNGVMAA
jgi:hypothetical protein